ncbi:hypothetical protein GA707_20115 [Nostocoides sp. F2B08]|jgi:hypothetical protein|uniref:hypothetical protein n=1 Tax=Nostocoides sp. F2B08 TaxID=2653936 RepID=UPI001262F336|nr:hypothetical protein [Tetrasphaera sp. F2B08]KAB7739784.1 hypothetical protein GA707_20115 [Tetrasphaera sp. F2B08]
MSPRHKMSRSQSHARAVATLAIAFGASGCSGSDTGGPASPSEIPAVLTCDQVESTDIDYGEGSGPREDTSAEAAQRAFRAYAAPSGEDRQISSNLWIRVDGDGEIVATVRLERHTGGGYRPTVVQACAP